MLSIERKLRFLFHLCVAYTRRHLLRLLAGIVIFFVASLLISRFLGVIFGGRGNYVEALVGVYSSSVLPERATVLVSSGLTKIDKNGEVKGELAKTWEILDGGKIYRFHLNDNLFWQDGSPLKSQEVDLAIDGVDLSYPDDKTIDFKLTEPFAPLPSLVAKPLFKKNSTVGVGRYKIESVTQVNGTVQEIVLTDLSRAKPKLIFRIYPTASQAILAFKQGEVQTISAIPQLNGLRDWPNTETVEFEDQYSVVAIYLNTRSELFSKKESRLALSKGITFSDLPGRRAVSPISFSSWAFNPEVKSIEYSRNQAQKAIDESTLKQTPIKLVSLPIYQKLAEKVAEEWRSLGLKVELKIVNSVPPQEFDALIAGQEIPKDPDQYGLWHSTQDATNLTKISSPRIDKLLEDGRRFDDQKTRKEKYLEFQRVIFDEVPAIFLYYPNRYYVYRKRIKSTLDSLYGLNENFPTPR